MKIDLATEIRVKLLLAGIKEPEEIVTHILKICKEHYELSREEKDRRIEAITAKYRHEPMLTPERRQDTIAREIARIEGVEYKGTVSDKQR